MRPIVSGCLVALSLLVLGGSALADTITYRWVDAQGVVHYSDQPHPGAQEIHLTGAQTYHGTPDNLSSAASPAAPPPAASPSAYRSCAITQPVADSSLFAPEAVDVSVRLSPALRPGDQLGVLVDGAALQPQGDGGSFQLPAPDRGAHTVTAEVRDAEGTVLCSATAVTFYVQRPSVNSPASPIKPH
jgi:hypothetical protein